MSTQPADSVRKASSNHLDRKVAQYSLAAAVAGVGILALTAPAMGEVVVTKKTIHVPLTQDGRLDFVSISMANNGIDNFTFSLVGSATRVGREVGVRGLGYTQSATPNAFIAGGDFYARAMPLARGAEIGPSGVFAHSGLVEETASSRGDVYSRGSWGGNPKNKYVGVRFQLNGQTHFGWIRLTVTSNVKLKKPTLEATITGWGLRNRGQQANQSRNGGDRGKCWGADCAESRRPKNFTIKINRDHRWACWREEQRACQCGGAKKLLAVSENTATIRPSRGWKSTAQKAGCEALNLFVK